MELEYYKMLMVGKQTCDEQNFLIPFRYLEFQVPLDVYLLSLTSARRCHYSWIKGLTEECCIL